MTGHENVHIVAVAEDTSDITEFARDLQRIGYDVVDETLIREQTAKPFGDFDVDPAK